MPFISLDGVSQSNSIEINVAEDSAAQFRPKVACERDILNILDVARNWLRPP